MSDGAGGAAGNRTRWLAIGAVVVALLLSALWWSRSRESASPPPTPALPPEAADISAGLEGTVWVLDGTADGAEVTAVFDRGSLDGSAGCNTYTSSYRLGPATNGNTIYIRPPAFTEMACEPPVMADEQAYLSALPLVESYQILGDRLQLFVGSETLSFTARQASSGG